MRKLKGATCCSGIGAPECALPEIEWIWCAENQKFPSAVLAHHHPNSQNLGDMLDPDFITRATARGKRMVEIKNGRVYSTPDGSRYRALGNSMALPCIRMIGRRIISAIHEYEAAFKKLPATEKKAKEMWENS